VTDADSRVASGPAGGARTGGGKKDDGGLGTHFNELLALVTAYAKQETVAPLKNLGRYIAWGAIGIVMFSTGAVFATLTAIRVVQSETGRHLHGELTWVPYLAGMLVAVLGAAWAASKIIRGDKALKETRQ
jgi:hypothetical protein